MGRMHSGGKGISASALPYKRTPPSWLKTTATQVEEQVNKLAKRGLTPSQVIIISTSIIRMHEIDWFALFLNFNSDWCYLKRFSRCCSSQERHW